MFECLSLALRNTSYTSLFLYAIIFGLSSYFLQKSVKKRKKQHGLFKRLGIPYIKPHLIYGSYHILRGSKNKNSIDITEEWIQKYGEIFGFYTGATPYISISNLDLVKQVLVKNFANFVNRPKLVIEADPVTETVVGLRDQRWKDVRALLAPTFSAAKMKLMIESMNLKVDYMIQILESASSENKFVDLYEIFQGLTLDVISECALAMETNAQRDQDNDPFLKAVRSFLTNAVNPAVRLAIYFPMFGKILAFISNRLAVSGRATAMIKSNLIKVISQRKSNSKFRRTDVLQLMLDIQAQSSPDSESNQKTLSDKEVIANAWVFLLGGFETTAASLTFCSYLLAKHPEIQENLYQEIKRNIKSTTPHLTYDDVFNLKYLDQVFNESLRLYPPVVTFTTREAKEDILLDNGLLVPKNTAISVPIWHIHHNENYWPKPNEFDPERFSSHSKISENRHSMSFIPFGEGPRKCIGMRFAQMEAKLALARLILHFKLETCEETPDPLTFKIPTVTLVPKEKIFVKIVKRLPEEKSL